MRTSSWCCTPLTDHRRELFVDRHAEQLQAPPEFQLVASFNPGYRRGPKELKPSTRQRFVGIDFTYPEPSVEAEIVAREVGIDAAVAKRLVVLARKVRSLSELGLAETVSTRLLVNAGRLIRADVPPRVACVHAVVAPLTDDPEIAEALRDVVHLVF